MASANATIIGDTTNASNCSGDPTPVRPVPSPRGGGSGEDVVNPQQLPPVVPPAGTQQPAPQVPPRNAQGGTPEGPVVPQPGGPQPGGNETQGGAAKNAKKKRGKKDRKGGAPPGAKNSNLGGSYLQNMNENYELTNTPQGGNLNGAQTEDVQPPPNPRTGSQPIPVIPVQANATGIIYPPLGNAVPYTVPKYQPIVWQSVPYL